MISSSRIRWLAMAIFPALVISAQSSRAADPILTEDLFITINGQTLSFGQELARPRGAERFIKLGTAPEGADKYVFSIPRRKIDAQVDFTSLSWKQVAGCEGIPSYKEGEVSGVIEITREFGRPLSPTIKLTAG